MMNQLFSAIVSKGAKDNTYKFALSKFLLDYANTTEVDATKIISYSTIAEKFLEYYWFQECKYKLKQDFKIKRMPVIIKIIREHCGIEYIPFSYERYFKSRISQKKLMIEAIEQHCLMDVIPRLQPKGTFSYYKHYHTLSSNCKKYRVPPKDKRYIELSQEAHLFLKENYENLHKILIYEWAKFLEKTNFTPRLIAKIEGLGLQKRGSLKRYREILLDNNEKKCFYCNNLVKEDDIHVDHFIPWSYIFEDQLWNLVISCSDCNLKKSDNLAPKICVKKIDTRNSQYNLNPYDKNIKEYYESCYNAGFSQLLHFECKGG